MGGRTVTIVLILISVFLGVAGQVFLKQGVLDVGPVKFNREIFKILIRPFVLLGLVCYATSSFFWLLVLSQTELSYAYPMVALGYVFVFFFSWWFFHDKVTLVRILGLVLIVVGVVLVAITSPKKMEQKTLDQPTTVKQLDGE
jgi:multidrug transporter EmrE-like cation transporter